MSTASLTSEVEHVLSARRLSAISVRLAMELTLDGVVVILIWWCAIISIILAAKIIFHD